MEQTLSYLRNRFPRLQYREGATFCWSPENQIITFIPNRTDKPATWALLHETSHALLEHASYHSDAELLQLEVMAWEKAKELGQETGIEIDEDHIQDCLDSYRDWIYARSICPRCGNKSLQQNDTSSYRCFNCSMQWRVTNSRFCRAYRSHVPTKAARASLIN